LLQNQGIRLQTTELHCPWQNGRIERLFGTLKQQLDRIQVESAEHLQTLLDEFKRWYNTIRLHRHLGYQTPQEAWQQQIGAKTSKSNSSGNPQWWTGWGGQLSGLQLPCCHTTINLISTSTRSWRASHLQTIKIGNALPKILRLHSDCTQIALRLHTRKFHFKPRISIKEDTRS
jgi:Integrase core domain